MAATMIEKSVVPYPTRMSVENGDPGCCKEATYFDGKVYCDGEWIKWVITVDTKLGYVKYYACRNGQKVRHYVKGDEQLLVLERYGTVRLETKNV